MTDPRIVINFLLAGGALLTPAVAQPSALVPNPTWVSTDKLNTAREYHAATLLPDGRVLVTGGDAWVQMGSAGAFRGCNVSAEIFDPSTGAWRPTGNLNVARSGHTSTLLPTGHVLVAGGNVCSSGGLIVGVTASAELYDPATGRWRTTASPITARSYGQTVTLLADGRVLIAGGSDRAGNGHRSAELYDPVTERWSSTGATSRVSGGHTTALLPDGKVLAIGNRDCVRIAELYDPATGQWSPTPSPPAFGCADSSTLLPNGQVLVTGNGKTQLYNPATGEWSISIPLTLVGGEPRATLLANGQVLAAGGWAGDVSVRAAEIYDPASGTWGSTAALNRPRAAHTATRLLNGKLLFVGGVDGYCCDARDTLDTAELFDLGLPQSGTVATSVSAASYRVMGLAAGSLAVSFGGGMPTQPAGTSVRVKDSAGTERIAPLLFVSPTQVTYQIPPGTVTGAATVTVARGNETISTGVSLIHRVAPGLFTANGDGQGVAAAFLRRVRPDGSVTDEPVAQFDAAQDKFVPLPLDLGPETDRVFLILFGTGIRFRSSLSAVIAAIGGAYAGVTLAEAHPDWVGVDQVDVLLPRSLAGRGEVDVLLTVDVQMANPVRISIK